MTRKSARVQLIENTTEKVSRILAENYGIQVVFKGDLCCTDGKRIFLPVIGDGAPEEFMAAIPGMVDHESSHVLHSNFTTVPEEIKASSNPKKLHNLVNICEDARIEAAMVKKWRGCRPNFEKTATWASKKLIANWDRLSEWGKIAQLCGAVACLGMDDDFTKWAIQQEPKLWDHVKEVVPELLSAKNQPSNEATLKLGQDILDKLHEKADPEEEKEEEGDKDGDSQGPGKTGRRGKKSRRQKDPGNTPAAPGDDEQDQDESDGDDSEEGDDDGAVEEDSPESLKRDFDPSDQQQEQDDQLSNRQRMMSEEARKNQQQNRGIYLVYTTENDVVEPVQGGDAQAARRLLDESKQITNVMKTRMMRNLLARNRARRDPGKERGKIDRRSLFKVSLETSKKVFWQKVEAPEFNTRASLWVDHSGSMNGQKMRLAAASAMLFGEVLEALRIPFEVCGFSTSTTSYQGCHIYEQASPADRKVFTRWGGLWVGIYKGFDEPWHSVKQRCASMERHHHDNTYDGEALRLAAQRLLGYQEPRRILFWFNDGEPCPNVQQFIDDHELYLKRVAKEVEKVIEVFAVGIMTDNVKRYFSNAVVINNLQDLPKVMMGELDRLLRKNQQAYLGAR